MKKVMRRINGEDLACSVAFTIGTFVRLKNYRDGWQDGGVIIDFRMTPVREALLSDGRWLPTSELAADWKTDGELGGKIKKQGLNKANIKAAVAGMLKEHGLTKADLRSEYLAKFLTQS